MAEIRSAWDPELASSGFFMPRVCGPREAGEHLNKSRVGQKEKRAKQNGLGDSLYFLKNVKQERF
jgi:hypothetical protein